MRDAYRQQLETVTGRLVDMTRTVGEQIVHATEALLEADLDRAEHVVSSDSTINRVQHEVDEHVVELAATQSPVASELREVMTALRMTSDLERMGDLAVHIAKIARMRYPDRAVPDELHDTFASMGHTAETMAAKAGEVVRTRDLTAAKELARDDNEMDRLHRSLFLVLFDDDWARGVEAAVDVALLGRYYERYADHAVEIAMHVRYLVTGEMP